MTQPSKTCSLKSTTNIPSPPSTIHSEDSAPAVRDTAGGAFTVIPARRGFSALYKGKALLSRIDPVSQAERLASEALPLKPQTLYLCPRPLFGYGLPALLQNLPESSALAALEADETLYAWTLNNTNESLLRHPRFSLFFDEKAKALFARIQAAYPPRSFRRVEALYNSAAWQLDGAFFTEVLEAAREALAIEWGNAMTLTKLGRLYARNAFRNLRLLSSCPSLAGLSFGQEDTLVCGAGPSLDAAARELSKTGTLRGRRFRIVAVDTALSALLDWGIKPDLVIALEAQHWNIADFTGLRGLDIPLAMDFSALPLTAGVFARPPYLFWTEWTKLRFISRLRCLNLLPLELPALGSVGLSAYAAARALTGGEVVCEGLDFSFSACLYHCRARPSHKKALRECSRVKSIYPLAGIYREGSFAFKTADGRAGRSDPALERYRKLFAVSSLAVDGGAEANGMGKREAVTAEREALLAAFTAGERERLAALLAILKGESSLPARLEGLIDECDYLWAHFPDCAGKNGWRPPITDTGFLKRLRAEIEPFLALLPKF